MKINATLTELNFGGDDMVDNERSSKNEKRRIMNDEQLT